MGKYPPHWVIILSPRNATITSLFGLGANTTLGLLTLIMRWVSEGVLVVGCMAGTMETRIPGHKMFGSGDRQE